MNNRDRILAFLKEHQPEGFDDDELSAQLHIFPRQQVNHICRRLASDGLVRRAPSESGKIHNYYADNIDCHAEAQPPQYQLRQPSDRMTASDFERLAERAMSDHFGVSLAPKKHSRVPKTFDLVSGDEVIVGDAKFLTMVGGQRRPSAKFSMIAEHVWLLEKTHAQHKFLVFGNDIRVPSQWLQGYGRLVSGVDFYFVDREGKLQQLRATQ